MFHDFMNHAQVACMDIWGESRLHSSACTEYRAEYVDEIHICRRGIRHLGLSFAA